MKFQKNHFYLVTKHPRKGACEILVRYREVSSFCTHIFDRLAESSIDSNLDPDRKMDKFLFYQIHRDRYEFSEISRDDLPLFLGLKTVYPILGEILKGPTCKEPA